jgi:hypothetical protein
MFRLRALTRCHGLVAVLLLGCLARSASAQTLTLRNQCDNPVIVQVAGIHRGIFRRDRPRLLQPGETTPRLAVPGDKILTIFDAQMPNRVLLQSALSASSPNRQFLILPDPPSLRVRLQPHRPPRS